MNAPQTETNVEKFFLKMQGNQQGTVPKIPMARFTSFGSDKFVKEFPPANLKMIPA